MLPPLVQASRLQRPLFFLLHLVSVCIWLDPKPARYVSGLFSYWFSLFVFILFFLLFTSFLWFLFFFGFFSFCFCFFFWILVLSFRLLDFCVDVRIVWWIVGGNYIQLRANILRKGMKTYHPLTQGLNSRIWIWKKIIIILKKKYSLPKKNQYS